MSEYVFKLPDLGEGTVEAEVVEWHVQVGDVVREGDAVVDVMTDKANVEVSAPADGQVLRISGQPGEVLAVGSELMALELSEQAPRRAPAAESPPDVSPPPPESPESGTGVPSQPPPPKPAPGRQWPPADVAAGAGEPSSRPARVLTSPAIRRRAKEAGIDLGDVAGSGPRGRILRRDFEAALAGSQSRGRPLPGDELSAAATAADYQDEKVIGIRRVIAERMSRSKREIPHFAYVEEVDVTELEALRRHVADRHEQRLSVLPLIALALMRALRGFPQCNCRFDAEAGTLRRFRPVHLGVATQTPDGLKVPVVHNADGMDLWRLTAEIARVAEAARSGRAGREDLSGSTITITSLGRMGGVVTTPVINYPEVSIIGVNKVVERPMVVEGQVRVRSMMNLSSSFDHRFVDGFDAAAMIQRVRELLEHPATIFLPEFPEPAPAA